MCVLRDLFQLSYRQSSCGTPAHAQSKTLWFFRTAKENLSSSCTNKHGVCSHTTDNTRCSQSGNQRPIGRTRLGEHCHNISGTQWNVERADGALLSGHFQGWSLLSHGRGMCVSVCGEFCHYTIELWNAFIRQISPSVDMFWWRPGYLCEAQLLL